MPSTFSQNLRLELIGAGEQSGVWNVTTNGNLGTLIEQAITGQTDLDVTLGNITLTALNGTVDQSRSIVLSVTGTPGTTRVITIPNLNKPYTVKNRSDATVQIKTSGGTAFDIPTLSEAYVYCDGNDAVTGRYITDGAQNSVLATQTPYNDVALTGVPTAPTASFGTSTTQLATTAFVQTALQAIYPIGSVYINADSETSPATLLGFGSWTAIGEGQVLVGQNAADADFDVLAKTGGSKDAVLVSHTHSATVSTESVDHTHTWSGSTGGAGAHSHSGSANHVSLSGDFWVGGGNNGTSGIVSQIATGGRPGLDANSGFQQLYRVNASHSHSLSINGVGDHLHSVSGSNGFMSANANHTHTVTNSNEGESGTGKNLQPYLVVKMWKRVS